MEVYIVRWTYKADNYPYLQVFATEKLAEDAKWYGDNDPRNVSKRIEKQEVIGLNTQKTDNFDLKEYLAEGRLTNEGIFSTSPEKKKEKEKIKVEDALDRRVEYSMESGVSEEDIIKMGRKYLRDSIDAYMGGKIDSDELDKMYDDVMSKVPDDDSTYDNPNEPVIWKV